MHQLLIDTEYATKSLFSLLTEEERQLAELTERQASLQMEFAARQWDFDTSDLNDDFSDAYVMNAFARMARTHEQKVAVEAEIASLAIRIASREMATQAVAGAILQIAKQLLSIAYEQPENMPEGEAIATTCTRKVIIAARNQAMHYEEGSPQRKATRETFEILTNSFGNQFNLTDGTRRSRAKEVLRLLGWSEYEKYVMTMATLLPLPPRSQDLYRGRGQRLAQVIAPMWEQACTTQANSGLFYMRGLGSTRCKAAARKTFVLTRR